jgi:hypothetical protein
VVVARRLASPTTALKPGELRRDFKSSLACIDELLTRQSVLDRVAKSGDRVALSLRREDDGQGVRGICTSPVVAAKEAALISRSSRASVIRAAR